jgi:hypothetical protein
VAAGRATQAVIRTRHRATNENSVERRRIEDTSHHGISHNQVRFRCGKQVFKVVTFFFQANHDGEIYAPVFLVVQRRIIV